MKRTFNLLVLVTMLALVFSTFGSNPAYAAGSWETVGAAGFSAGAIHFLSLAMDNSDPYVAYADGANSWKATVMKFNGTTWETVGAAGFSAGGVGYVSLAVDNGTPYVAYQDVASSGRATVMKFNGASWETVGAVGFSAGAATSISLAMENGAPYVAYSDVANSYKATVMKFNGTTWETVGAAGFSAGSMQYTSLAIENGTPYVAYEDDANSYKATVMKFNGTIWEVVGAAGFSAGAVTYTSLVVDNSTPYVAYSDVANSYKATVMKFNGTTWEDVGVAGLSAGGVSYPSLVVDNGTPYVAYSDSTNSNKATVMKFNGASWETIGTAGFSAGQADDTSLVVDNGTPYVAYQDYANSEKVTVMKYADMPAGTLTVQSAADDGTTVPANCPGAGCRLRDAITAANPGDTINFSFDYPIALASTLYIDKDLTIDGSGHTVTLTGDTDSDNVGDVRVMYVETHVTLTLNSLFIAKGVGQGYGTSYGGGIFSSDFATLTVTDCVFSYNSADRGGGIFNEDGTLIVTGSTFSRNSANNGGGIYSDYGSLTVTDSTFSANNTISGGGIYNYSGTAVVTGSTFSRNYPTDNGGGIFNDQGTLTVTGNTFSEHTVNASGGGLYNYFGSAVVTNNTFTSNSALLGGGLYNFYSSAVVTNNTFTSNSAFLGGGINNDYGTLTVTDSTFFGNSATNRGGGVYTNTDNGSCANLSATTITNSTFSGNSATDGGGIYNFNGVTTLLFNTITASPSGGGVFSFNDAATCTKAGSNIIAGNIGNDVSAYDITQRFYSLDYNLVGVAGANVDFGLEFNQPHDQVNVLDPMLGALADNGGPTQTHALLGGSPAIDAGDDVACAASPINGLDQRGVARPQGAHCDIGAFEMDNHTPTDIGLSNSTVIENQPFGTTVGILTTTDPDAGDTHTYSFCGGANDASFAINSDELETAAVFDYETKNTYTICVRTDDGKGGIFDKSFTITVTNIPNVELMAPWNGEDTHTNRPEFRWNAFAGAAQYQIQIALEPTFAKPALKKTLKATLTNYVPTKNLLPNTIYYWRVRAKVGKTYTDWSDVWTFATGNPPPIPVLTSPGNNKMVTVFFPLFDWKDVKAVAGVTFDYYEIQISMDADFATIFGTGMPVDSQYDGFILPTGTYYWRVRSVADNGDFSAWSKMRIVMTQ